MIHTANKKGEFFCDGGKLLDSAGLVLDRLSGLSVNA
jgi:hypothetical protein